MIAFIKEKYFGLLDDLDFLSSQIRKYTYDLGPIIIPRSSQKAEQPATGWAFAIEAFIVLLLLATLATYSRMAQFDVMTESMADFFLQGLANVSTTHDSGYFMSQARDWIARLASGQGFPDVTAGQLPGYLVASIALLLKTSLEEAGRVLVYVTVSLTAFSAYLLCVSLRQASLGILAGVGTIFLFPVYSRTSLGMIDTDLLNLFFVLAVLAPLNESGSSRKLTHTVVFAAAAGALNYLFQLWYNTPGFTLIFFLVLVGVLISSRCSILSTLIAPVTFLITSGLENARGALSNFDSFLTTYVFRGQPGATEVTTSVDLVQKLREIAYPTVNEIQLITASTIQNDYFSVWLFVVSIVGLLIWLGSDWRRFIVLSPLLTFGILYFTSGQRFSFYFATLYWIGLITVFATVALKLMPWAYRGLHQPITAPNQDGFEPRTETGEGDTTQKERFNWSAAIFSITFLAATYWLAVLTPLRIMPPPAIQASQLKALKDAVDTGPNKNSIVATWWDYGHEVRYQTQREILSDGGNPASVKNFYLARALVSTDPYVAADEVRFASYFTEQTLLKTFPRRPEIDLATKTDHDIYLFLPDDLQHVMLTVLKIAATTMSRESLVGYNPQNSAFFNMYHRAPQKYGPFELVRKEPNGVTIYRLPAVSK